MARAMLGVVITALLALLGLAEARPGKPRVPAGRDPGGIAVAIIGGGIDYRGAEIAARLARDGEGELIGWDFVDDDARPFSDRDDDGALAGLLSAEGQGVRLVPVRVAAGRHDQIAAALRFVGNTPARVALIIADPGAPLPLAGLAEAARHLSGLLVVVPARHMAEVVPAPSLPEGDRAGLLVVTVSGIAAVADVAAAIEPAAGGPMGADAADKANREDRATVRVAALAARLIRDDPKLAGAALRTRLLSYAKPQPPGPPAIPDITHRR